MIYKFKSQAAGDVIMLGPNGDQLLRLIGREPASQGIIEPAAMAAAISALEAAVAAEEAAPQAQAAEVNKSDAAPRAISLHQRMWPMVEMLKRALSERQPIVWGV